MMEMAVAACRKVLIEVQRQERSIARGQRGLCGEGDGSGERRSVSGEGDIGWVVVGICAAATSPPIVIQRDRWHRLLHK